MAALLETLYQFPDVHLGRARRRGRLAGPDRGKDDFVLADRLGGGAGQVGHHQLVTAQAGADPVIELGDQPVAALCHHQVVELCRDPRVFIVTACSHGPLHVGDHHFKGVEHGLRLRTGQQARRLGFEHAAHRKKLAQFALGAFADHGAAIGLDHDEAFAREDAKRFAQRDPADAKAFREALLLQASAGRQHTAHDRVAQRARNAFGEERVALHVKTIQAHAWRLRGWRGECGGGRGGDPSEPIV